MAPFGLCCRKKSPEDRHAPPKYASTVSVQDRIFFLRLLFRWTGSVWQMLWIDVLIFIILYTAINALYFVYLIKDTERRVKFESFIEHVQKIATSTPLSFLLGFFVSAVLARWWQVCMCVPWLSQPSILLQTYISNCKSPELAQKVRINILRYMNLAWIIGMKPLSLQIFERFSLSGERKSDFQSLRHTVDTLFLQPFRITSGVAKESKSKLMRRMDKINEDTHVKKTFGRLITPYEVQIFAGIAKKNGDENYQGDYWLPLQWCTRILIKAREAGLIVSDFEFCELTKLVDGFRGSLGTLSVFNDINIPIVYTQVIVFAVYTYFLSEVFSSQLIKKAIASSPGSNATIINEDYNWVSFDNIIPIFSIFKFIFTMGWFKTAASLLNPLGNDKHDLPTSLMLDYNLMIGFQSGDAQDNVYPQALQATGNALAQLEQLDMFPSPGDRPAEHSLEEGESPECSESVPLHEIPPHARQRGKVQDARSDEELPV